MWRHWDLQPDGYPQGDINNQGQGNVLQLSESPARKIQQPEAMALAAKTLESPGLCPCWGRSVQQRHLQSPMLGAGGIEGTRTPLQSIAGAAGGAFPSSPHFRLPGNTTCQQDAVGLIKLPPRGIWWWQAEGATCQGDRSPLPSPVPSASGRAVMLGLEGWKTAGYSCRVSVC